MKYQHLALVAIESVNARYMDTVAFFGVYSIRQGNGYNVIVLIFYVT